MKHASKTTLLEPQTPAPHGKASAHAPAWSANYLGISRRIVTSIPNSVRWFCEHHAMKFRLRDGLVGATVRGTVSHAALLVHRVKLAIGVRGRGNRIPHAQRVPSRHSVLFKDKDEVSYWHNQNNNISRIRGQINMKSFRYSRRCRRGPPA